MYCESTYRYKITDCRYNYGYNSEVMFPVTHISNATNETKFLSHTLGCVNGVLAPTNAVTEAHVAHTNSDLLVGAPRLFTHTSVSMNITLGMDFGKEHFKKYMSVKIKLPGWD